MEVTQRILEYERGKGNWFIVPIGDSHVGSKNTVYGDIEYVVDFIEKTPNALWIGMGDYAEAITPKDTRFDLRNFDIHMATPRKQYGYIEGLFERIKDKGLGLIQGNHDWNLWKYNNHDYVEEMGERLGIPYLGYDGYIRLRLIRSRNRLNFNIYAHHGNSSARTTGGKINRIEDLDGIVPLCNLYLMGHVHLSGPSPACNKLRVDNRLNIKFVQENFCFTGSFLKGYMKGNNTYIERKGYKPTSLGSPLINLQVKRREFGWWKKQNKREQIYYALTYSSLP